MKDLPRVHELSMSWVHRDPTEDIFWRGEEWPPDGHPFWDGLFHLAQNPWFTRLWTFQEVALAKRAYMFYEETWITLYEFLAFFWPATGMSDGYVCPEDHHYDRMPSLDSSLPATRTACYVIVWRQAYEKGAPVQPADLPNMLYHIRQRGVKERVDRVWAIAGILPETMRDRLSSEVDYTDDARAHYWKTYLSFAKAVFEGEQSLALLNMPPSARHHNTHLPSWCPDLSAEPNKLLCSLQIDRTWRRSSKFIRTAVWWPDLQLDEQEIDRKRAAVVNHASKLISIDANNAILHIRGFVVDTIKEVVDGTGMLPLWKQDRYKDWRELDPGNVIDRVVIKYFLEGLSLAQRTCPGQEDTARSPPKEFVGCFFHESYVSIQAERVCTEIFHRLRLFAKGIKQSYRDLSTDERHWYTNFWLRTLLPMTGHSFFATSNGRFGVATPGCKAGDKICVFYSGEPLYILPHEGTGPGAKAVKFGGVAFIPHMMDQDQRDNARLGPDEIYAIS